MFLSVLTGSRAKVLGDGDWCCRSETNVVKGICICCVVISHTLGVCDPTGWMASSARLVSGCLGQLIVVPFLFFSGLGLSESIRSKGKPYVYKIPCHRIIPVLLNYQVSVLVFALIFLALGWQFDVNRLVKALIGWRQLGCPSWYIFVILACYFILSISSFETALVAPCASNSLILT